MTARRGTVRVLTWNVHAGIGPDGRFDLERVVRLVQRHDPDIVALQEIDSRGHGDGLTSPFHYITRTLGRHAAEARTIVAPDGAYGHVVVSRWPLRDVMLHDLSVSGREPRCAIEANVETPLGTIHLAAVHLGLRLMERRRQAAKLAEIAGDGEHTTVMLGDFNDWFARGAVRRSLGRLLPARTMHATFPACRPLFRLDRIYCRPAEVLLRSWVDPAGRTMSDHLPVIADLKPVPVPSRRRSPAERRGHPARRPLASEPHPVVAGDA